MTRPDPIEFRGEWRQLPGGVRVPVLPGDTEPTIRRHRHPQRSRRQPVPGCRATYRTEFCACGCLLVVGETCPNCGGRP